MTQARSNFKHILNGSLNPQAHSQWFLIMKYLHWSTYASKSKYKIQSDSEWFEISPSKGFCLIPLGSKIPSPERGGFYNIKQKAAPPPPTTPPLGHIDKLYISILPASKSSPLHNLRPEITDGRLDKCPNTTSVTEMNAVAQSL
jgi:hypothetical protein